MKFSCKMKVAFVAFFGTSCLVSADRSKLLKRGGTVRGAQSDEDITEDVAFWTRMLQMGSMPDRPMTPSPTPTNQQDTAFPTRASIPQTPQPTDVSIETPQPTNTSIETPQPTDVSIPQTPQPTDASIPETPQPTPFPTVGAPDPTNPPMGGGGGGNPTANDDAATMNAGDDAFISVLDNDTPGNPNDSLFVKAITSGASNGICAISLSIDEVVYTPNNGFTGSDSCEYEACDSIPLCDTAKVTITVV
ncbi:predicted protein [Thalassiosira pseudonana CCMP1335]|jgi:hypothetical protein|uniref:Uncharacterized protein n=1 Tax=Thalassiosira pseudonana TaxID=35128 RepID=B8BQT1_THAPS|nr:predicted protein [Thalassiosira pseudonana CCMP1335]EED96418.1 predicted protein [Thalassiosira pseudonana CCMP1335]|eukprot:g935.t1 g935   contig10:1029729-1030859(-)